MNQLVDATDGFYGFFNVSSTSSSPITAIATGPWVGRPACPALAAPPPSWRGTAGGRREASLSFHLSDEIVSLSPQGLVAHRPIRKIHSPNRPNVPVTPPSRCPPLLELERMANSSETGANAARHAVPAPGVDQRTPIVKAAAVDGIDRTVLIAILSEAASCRVEQWMCVQLSRLVQLPNTPRLY